MSEAKPPIPRFPGGPDPEQPIPRTAVEGIDLPRYAFLSVSITDRPTARAELLAGNNLTEASYLRVETTWLLRIATATLVGDLELARDYDQATVAAQEELTKDQPIWPMEHFAAVTAQIESGYVVAQVLSHANLTMAGFAHQQRLWSFELAKAPDRASAFRGLVDQWKRQWGPPR